MDYKELIEHPDFSSPAKVGEWVSNAHKAITDLLARAEAAEAENAVLRQMQPAKIDGDTLELATEVLELRQRLEEVKAQRDEAVHDRMMMEQRTGELNARAEKAERERGKILADVNGICYLCENGKPFKSSINLRTCKHFKGRATNSERNCPHFRYSGWEE